MNWKIIYKPLEKFGISLIEVIIAFGLMFLTENPDYLFLIPALELLRNVFKHTFLPKFLNWLKDEQ